MLERRETVEGFLEDLRRDLRRLDEPYLQQILSETEGHLRQSVEELVELGVTPREAETAAVAAFGRPTFTPPPSRASRLVPYVAAASAFAGTALTLSSLDDLGSGRASAPLFAGVVLGPLFLFVVLGFLGAAPRWKAFGRMAALGSIALLTILPACFVVRPNAWNIPVLPMIQDPFFADYTKREFYDLGNPSSIPQFERHIEAFDAVFARFAAGLPVDQGPTMFVATWQTNLVSMSPERAREAWAKRGSAMSETWHDCLTGRKEEAALLEAALQAPYGDRLLQMSPWAVVLPVLWFVASMLFQAAGYVVYLAKQRLDRRARA